MTMVPSTWRKRATQDGRHIGEDGRTAGYADVPDGSRAAATAIILWSCVSISFAWATFLVLVMLMR